MRSCTQSRCYASDIDNVREASLQMHCVMILTYHGYALYLTLYIFSAAVLEPAYHCLKLAVYHNSFWQSILDFGLYYIPSVLRCSFYTDNKYGCAIDRCAFWRFVVRKCHPGGDFPIAGSLPDGETTRAAQHPGVLVTDCFQSRDNGLSLQEHFTCRQTHPWLGCRALIEICIEAESPAPDWVFDCLADGIAPELLPASLHDCKK